MTIWYQTAVYQLVTIRTLAHFLSPSFGCLSKRFGCLLVWLGPFLFARFGFSSNGLISAIITVVTTLLLALWIREGEQQ